MRNSNLECIMESNEIWALKNRGLRSLQNRQLKSKYENESDQKKEIERKNIESKWKNLKFNPDKVLENEGKKNDRDCFKNKIFQTSINQKQLATLAFDFKSTNEIERYVENEDKTVQLVTFGLYEAALLGENRYFALQKNSSQKLLKSKAEFGRSLLYTSARSGYEECVFQLLKIGCDVNEVQENGSTPLHVAAFYGHEETVKILLAFGASNNIKNQHKHTPSDEAKTNKIKEIILAAQKDNIYLLFTQLKEMGLAYSLDRRSNDQIIRIYKKGKDQEILLKKFRNNPQYQRTFHGTKFTYLQSIFEHGLRRPDTVVGNSEVTIKPGHIKKGAEYLGIKNWSSAVFVSPSPFYAANPTYAGRVPCNGKIYCCLVEAMVVNDKAFYDTTGSTIDPQYKVDGEPDDVEFRIDFKHSYYFKNQTQLIEISDEDQSEDRDGYGGGDGGDDDDDDDQYEEKKEYSDEEAIKEKEMHKSRLRDSSPYSKVIKGFDFECQQTSQSNLENNIQEVDENEETKQLLTVFSILFIEESVFNGKLAYEEVIKLVEKYEII